MRTTRAAFLAALVLLAAAPAAATVTGSTYTVSYSPTVNTTVFAVPFHFDGKDDLIVVKTTEATSTDVTQTRGINYTVTLPRGSASGSVTFTSAVTSAYTVTITRSTPRTQLYDLDRQGYYSAIQLEKALDKLTLITQEIVAEGGEDASSAVADHVGESDPHTQYVLKTGDTGQTVKGGTTSGNLALQGNNSGTGKVLLGAGATELVVDEANNRVGVNTATPTQSLEVQGSAYVSGEIFVPTLTGITDLRLDSDNSTPGLIKFGSASAFDDANERLGINTLTPAYGLDNAGTSLLGDILVDADGDVTMNNATDALALSGSTTEVGSGAAGFKAYGSSHATLAEVAAIYGDTVYIFDENAFALAEFDSSGGVATGFISYGPIAGRHKLIAGGASYSLSGTTECGAVVMTSTDNAVITLPNAGSTNNGCEFTLINTAADDGALVSLSPHSSDSIYGTCIGVTDAAATSIVQLSGTADKDAQNTKAEANKSDSITVVSDGSGAWYVKTCTGVWASET